MILFKCPEIKIYIVNDVDNSLNQKQSHLNSNSLLNSSYVSYNDDTLKNKLDNAFIRIQGVETFNSNISNLDVLKDINFDNISDLVQSKMNVIDGNNRLNANFVQTTYGMNGNMTLNNALIDIRSGIDLNYGSIIDLTNNKQNNISENSKISYQFIETIAGNDLADIFISGVENKISGDYVKTNYDDMTVNNYIEANNLNISDLQNNYAYVNSQIALKQNTINSSN